MKKKIFKLICLLVCAVTALGAVLGLAACGKKAKLLEENIVDDKYDNFYEIFVYSFYDSDGDGYGDLNGVTQKLDYIRDLGYTGIWLMPINPCTSYHGYDVEDYCAINPRFGTLDDYKNLISSAHEKGIKVITDLVVNHTSSRHNWFEAALAGNPQYINYYNFSNVQQDGYHQMNGKWYESWFSEGMPDLNLENQQVLDEIEKIIKFWLDLGTDGFRLDGVRYYGTTSDKSIKFCTWLAQTTAKYNENAYVVGENWSSRSDIAAFYESGIDSFFYFDTAGSVTAAINTSSAAEMWILMKKCTETSKGNISAPFLSNHDNGMGRFAGRAGRKEEKIKFGYGLLSMMSGCTFTYYGDEIGMVAKNAQSDPDLRVGMLWDNKKTNLTKSPPGASADIEYIFDGVKEQLADPGSILNYYKRCNNARNAFPELMRGAAERITVDDENVLAFKKTYNGETVTVVINLSEEKKTVEGIQGLLAQDICVKGSVGRSGTKLTMPMYSIAILK